MTNYPNIEAIANGTISGPFSEWSRIKPEAMAILAELEQLERLILSLARILRGQDGLPCWCDNYDSRPDHTHVKGDDDES